LRSASQNAMGHDECGCGPLVATSTGDYSPAHHYLTGNLASHGDRWECGCPRGFVLVSDAPRLCDVSVDPVWCELATAVEPKFKANLGNPNRGRGGCQSVARALAGCLAAHPTLGSSVRLIQDSLDRWPCLVTLVIKALLTAPPQPAAARPRY
jgi:hypothetical protein